MRGYEQLTQKQYLKVTLIAGLILLSLGGLLLHLRIHSPAEDFTNKIPFIIGIISLVVLPVMFFFKKTVPYAYVLNGMIVIIGTITMAHQSLAESLKEITLSAILFRTTFADIMILFTKFAIGKALFELERTTNLESVHTGRFLRYPNMGWWIVHLIVMSVVYILGHLLWI